MHFSITNEGKITVGRSDFASGKCFLGEYYSEFSEVSFRVFFFKIVWSIFLDSSTKMKWGPFFEVLLVFFWVFWSILQSFHVFFHVWLFFRISWVFFRDMSIFLFFFFTKISKSKNNCIYVFPNIYQIYTPSTISKTPSLMPITLSQIPQI